MGRPRVEPSADQREVGLAARQMFLSFTENGFNHNEAMTLTVAWLQASIAASVTPPGSDGV